MSTVRQHHFHKQKIYLLRIFSIDPASISVKKGFFSSKQHSSTRRNNSLHPGYLTSLVTRTNHNTISTIDVYVLDLSGRITTTDRFSYHTGILSSSLSSSEACPSAERCRFCASSPDHSVSVQKTRWSRTHWIVW